MLALLAAAYHLGCTVKETRHIAPCKHQCTIQTQAEVVQNKQCKACEPCSHQRGSITSQLARETLRIATTMATSMNRGTPSPFLRTLYEEGRASCALVRAVTASWRRVARLVRRIELSIRQWRCLAVSACET